MNEIRNAEASKAHKIAVETENAEAAAKLLNGKSLKITAKAGQGGRLFGSVTAKEIAEKLQKDYNVTADKRKIVLDTEIKAFGTYNCEIKLYNGVSAKIYIVVSEA